MDDSKKTPPFAQGFGGAKQTDQANQINQPVGGRPASAQGSGGASKEAEVAAGQGDEYWENYAREIELEKEIEELGGVEKVESGEVKVPENLAKEMGLRPTTNIQTPISNVTSFTIKGVSLSDDQLSVGLTKPTSTGIRWLVEWFIYQLLKAHFHIQRIKGKIFREQGTGHREQGTGHREQGTGHREQGTGHREQGTGHREQGTRHRE